MTIELRRDDGVAYSGWAEASVTSSIEQVASSFTFRTFPQDDGASLDLFVGAAVEVWADDAPVCSGWIDEIEVSRTSSRREIIVSGRSRTADLVDNAAPVETIRRVALGRLAEMYGAEYGVEVTDLARDAHVFGRVRPEFGETCAEVLLRLAAKRGILVTNDAAGGLVLMRASSPPPAAGELRAGVNLLEIHARYSGAGRFARYEVRGQAIAESAALEDAVGVVSDIGATRGRVLRIKPDRPVDSAGARELAEWEAVTRAGQSQSVDAVVSGWHDASGAPWTKGTTIPVWDAFARLTGQRLLIVEVTHTIKDGEGRRTKLKLQPPEAFAAYTPGVVGSPAGWLSAEAQARAAAAIKAGGQ